jgi:hypothetical protein
MRFQIKPVGAGESLVQTIMLRIFLRKLMQDFLFSSKSCRRLEHFNELRNVSVNSTWSL